MTDQESPYRVFALIRWEAGEGNCPNLPHDKYRTPQLTTIPMGSPASRSSLDLGAAPDLSALTFLVHDLTR